MPRNSTRAGGRAASRQNGPINNCNGDALRKSESSAASSGSDKGAAGEEREEQDTQELRSQLTQERQHSRHGALIHLSPEEVHDIAELCLAEILDYEAEMAAIVFPSLEQSGSQPDGGGVPSRAKDSSGATDRRVRRKAAEVDGERNLRRRLHGLEPFAAYATVRPAYFQELRRANEAPGDLEVTQDPAFSEQDLAMYTRRTVTVLLLCGPSPMRVDDLRKCWLATPQHIRKRNFAALILSRTARTMACCFGLHMVCFSVRGTKYVSLSQGLRFAPHLRMVRSCREEELRGFLLFLGIQFLSEQAELPLEVLKSNLRLVGRNDLLRDFDEASLLKAVHATKEQAHKHDSLEALLTSCEALRYITITRRSSNFGEDAGDSLFIAPTHRFLQELQLDNFRTECRSNFGLEPPDLPLRPPEGEYLMEGPSQNETAS